MTVTIYSKPNCQQCKATYKRLDRNGTTYTVIDISENAEARDFVLSLNYQQAPVVVAGNVHWSGYRPDEIDSLKVV